ncbi:Rossmann fold nucleotide-binding protein [Phycicoccus sp. CSK15P-2]|uniref:LOG family protein n=1 Tax=Phycicoccus sp. CSK15P-2 TaxID=2807627 RepID=UPI00194E97C6|nr:Rossmann fold nucleotide-binding protein [Phycicoccus sp. CSK15P-2]MBM6404731.1 Rossmann fold nucleotide-binding protein [Phycicoccus sp. CSK15P-2]
MREIETLAALDAALDAGTPLRGLRLQDLDLTGRAARLLGRDDVEGLVVLGGRLPDDLDAHLRSHGALVFPTDPRAPVDPYRARLYTPDELYDGLREVGYAATPDARAHAWSRDAALAHDAFATLLRAIHDDSMSDALTDVLGTTPVVGVMGGHSLRRDEEGFARAAALGHALAGAGLVVATGGGPGAMEAANLGALARSADALADGVEALRAVPSFEPDVREWAALALDVRHGLLDGAPDGSGVRSIGIPTWHYGHEPPNVFCDGVAKYFSNAIREDGLLARSTAGVVVLEGAAGTVQEIFQAATALYYGDHERPLPRLVLVGHRHWSQDVPVWPALHALGSGRAMAEHVHLVDDLAEAVDVLST